MLKRVWGHTLAVVFPLGGLRRLAGRIGVAVALGLAATPVAAESNLAGTLGVRNALGDSQLQLGLVADVGVLPDVFHISMGAQHSLTGTVAGGSAITELLLGMKLKAERRRFQPYVGAGVVNIHAVDERTDVFMGSSESDSDTCWGYFAGAGVNAFLGKSFFLGLDAHYSGGAKLDLFGVEEDVDFITWSLTLGGSFSS